MLRAGAQTPPQVVTSGNVACGSGDSITCTTEVSAVTPLPVTVAVTNGQNADPNLAQTYPVIGTITGAGGVSGTVNLFAYGSFGQQPNDTYPSLPYVQGGPVTLTNSADLTLTNATASDILIETVTLGSGVTQFNTFLGGGALVALSVGSPGFPDSVREPDVGNFDGAQGGTVTLVNDGSLTVAGNGSFVDYAGSVVPVSLNALAAVSLGGNGAADKTGDTDYAGNGGAGGAVNVANAGSISISNNPSVAIPTYAIFALSQGGIGGNEKNYAAGVGGDGGNVTVVNSGSIANSAIEGVGIFAASFGGSSDFDDKDGGDDASGAGNGGAVQVTMETGSSLTMTGTVGIGILAISAGGDADNLWQGSGGDVTVTIEQGAVLSTTGGGSLSVGVLAVSAGSVGAVLPFEAASVNTAYPGAPGEVSVTNDGSVITAGSMAVGIAALSVGGASIVTNAAAGSSSTLGNVASGYGRFDAQSANVVNNGSVVTVGSGAHGLLALSVGGGGGLLSFADDEQVAFLGSVTTGSSGGDGAAVTIANAGSVVTGDGNGGGRVAMGIVAQSIGGGGGSSNAPAFFVGGNDTAGSGGGDGGSVTVSTSAGSNVTTRDLGALGILAQSVGGGGGNGANAAGIFAAVGGAGGNGGDGGAVSVDLANQGSGGIVTAGHFAAGLIAQSIGGGGGHGGQATTVGELLSVSVGGRGGNGGTGGTVTVVNVATIATAGNQALGVLAQSIGGGGGSGGAAQSFDAGLLTIAIAAGGAGGGGGAASAVSVTNDFHIYTGCANPASGCSYANGGTTSLLGANSIGIAAQSIGGGGGQGGAATAASLSLPSEDVPLTLSFDVAVGGSGGSGGAGAAVGVGNAGDVFTAGDGAYGVLAQSIGGGGGNGGDSTAAAYAIEGSVPSLKIALAVGGSGGSGGDGAAVVVGNGQTSTCQGCNGRIFTFGQNATGILAQSIGGGGGTGNSGNASASSPNLGDETGTSVDVTVGIGGGGGSGGKGGAVQVTNDAGSTIVTVGSGAQAIVAQSIGGGGGLAGGGSAASSGDTYQLNMAIGGKGGSGNDGGTVTVTNAGSIATGGIYINEANLAIVTGGDAVGILAQSIGGGGGTGGSSDPAATIDTRGQVLDALNAPSDSYSANIGLGGTGGAAGNGGTVEVGNAGTIATLGVRAHGVLAQSIGGGGGTGGAASSTSNSVLGGPDADKAGTYAADLAIGGSGGAAGNGGAVSVGNSGSVLTAGYGAHALFAQSVGGGGGVGAEGTVDNTTTIGLGAGGSGNGAAAGGGGAVEIEDEGTLLTAGDDAYGILAQSVGGGGGAAGVGCSNSADAGVLNYSASLCLGNSAGGTVSTSVWNDSSDFTLDLGGEAGASGDGGSVTVSKLSGGIVTVGARAVGILAQSVGGGGGLAAAADVNLADIDLDSGENGGRGGAVTVSLGAVGAAASAATITTYGSGAHGILAQSVGGGGGTGGDLSLGLGGPGSNAYAWTGSTDDDGGAVGVTVNGNLATFGANAHGIVAQSIGGGGGLMGIGGVLAAGNSVPLGGGDLVGGSGGAVTVTQQGGAIVTNGAGSIAIFAQSSGNDENQSPIQIDLSGLVSGGTGSGAAGVRLAGGISLGSIQANDGQANEITIRAGGSLGTADGIDGLAVLAEDSITTLSNAGTLTGSVDLGTAAFDSAAVVGTVTNSGTFNSGATVRAASLANSGTVAVAGSGNVGTTELSGSYTQSAGTLAVDIDVLQPQQADLLAVAGSASIAGTVAPTALSLLPGTYTVLSANSLTSTAEAQSSLLVDWQLLAGPTSLTLTPQVDFTPAGGSGLSPNEAAVAAHLQQAWDLGGSAALAPLFGSLSQLGDGDYEAALANLSPQNILARASDQVLASRAAMNTMLSCPVFEGDGTLLEERDCGWARVIGSHGSHGGDGGAEGYRTNTVSLRAGGQTEVADDWFVTGTLAYNMSWAESDSGRSNSQGNGFDVGLGLKYNAGPWLLAAGFSVGQAWYDNERSAPLGGGWESLSSDSSVLTLGGRLRVAYELPYADWYLRPYADFDLFYSHVPGYSESGDGALALDIQEQNETTFAFSPMLEAGGRLDFDDGWTLRPFLAAGVTLFSDDSWEVESSLQGAPDGVSSFTTETQGQRVLGNLDLGLQLFREQGFEVRLEYGLQAGQDYLAQSGGLRIAYRY